MKKTGARETPRNSQGFPQLRLLVIQKKVSEIVFTCKQSNF